MPDLSKIKLNGTVYNLKDSAVPAWAKNTLKPTYTANEVGALPNTIVIPTVPTNISAFTNDAGYLTLNTLPIYDGTVQNG